MKLPRRTINWAVLVSALGAILVALAILQVHWTNQVSQANRQRLNANLGTAVGRFRRDFYLQLLRVCRAFRPPQEETGLAAVKYYADRYNDWKGASARPGFVASVAVSDPSGQLWRLNAGARPFEPAEPASRGEERKAFENDLRKSGALPSAESDSQQTTWILDERSEVLFHPFGAAGGVIIQLSHDFLWHSLIPELTARYFGNPGSSNYRVTVAAGGRLPRLLYESMPAPPRDGSVSGDVDLDLVPYSRRDLEAADGFGESEARRTAAVEEDAVEDLDFGPAVAGVRLLTVGPNGEGWRLVVRYRSGSVEAAVQSLRHRNLAVSLGILLVLAFTMAFLIVSAQRARRLATSQINFVAGVSHELRTPLAVICSAAENLADGVIGVPEDVKRYGALIRDHGHRLSGMVAQVLLFAAGQSGRLSERREPVNVPDAVAAALSNLRMEIESHQVALEKRIPGELPRVMGDPTALAQCIQNLISNAIRYGGDHRRLEIRAEAGRDPDEVRIAVEDHGIGIEPEDLPRIFEPFYRGRNGARTEEHGTGLGLSLAKEIAEAMGGRISVSSAVGEGSRFTLHLPALSPHDKGPY